MAIPRITIGKRKLSCLILGKNPICGVSVQSDALSGEMAEYFTMRMQKSSSGGVKKKALMRFRDGRIGGYETLYVSTGRREET
jgi:hypothetical protein